MSIAYVRTHLSTWALYVSTIVLLVLVPKYVHANMSATHKNNMTLTGPKMEVNGRCRQMSGRHFRHVANMSSDTSMLHQNCQCQHPTNPTKSTRHVLWEVDVRCLTHQWLSHLLSRVSCVDNPVKKLTRLFFLLESPEKKFDSDTFFATSITVETCIRTGLFYHLVWATKLSLAAIGLIFPALVLGYKSFNCSMYQVPVPML